MSAHCFMCSLFAPGHNKEMELPHQPVNTHPEIGLPDSKLMCETGAAGSPLGKESTSTNLMNGLRIVILQLIVILRFNVYTVVLACRIRDSFGSKKIG